MRLIKFRQSFYKAIQELMNEMDAMTLTRDFENGIDFYLLRGSRKTIKCSVEVDKDQEVTVEQIKRLIMPLLKY